MSILHYHVEGKALCCGQGAKSLGLLMFEIQCWRCLRKLGKARDLLEAINPQVVGTWRVTDCVGQYGWGQELLNDAPEIEELLRRILKLAVYLNYMWKGS